MSRRRRSTDLPPDMLREISGRLHHAADFVRFHAVCRSWRDSYSRDVPPKSRTNQFLPWLLSPNDKDNKSIKIRCVFSKSSYRAPPSAHRRSWVANADGTAVRYFTAGPDDSGLHDPLTGAHTLPLPPFPQGSSSDQQWEHDEDPAGIVYGDGTILLFSDSTSQTRSFRAALLRPGDATWALVERNLIPNRYGEFCVVCHGGKIMVTVEGSEWHVIATNNGVVEDDDLRVQRTWLPRWEYKYYHHCYALETRGELLWLSVEVDLDYLDYPELCFSLVESLRVFVLTLQEVTTTEGPEKLMWVRKDGRSLADRVLFLGWPNSFAMEASHELGDDGGCAYFVYEDSAAIRRGQAAVFRYNFVDEEAELVEWLPEGWHDENCTWLVPQPVIAPVTIEGTRQ
uniref:Uncharacterized protein n=1 Tax=Avena sativa TaxID=4498 RepID=A0ACD5XAC0_AVESA